MGNIRYTDNTNVPYPPGGEFGGKVRQDFTYDNMYQLMTASGTFHNKRTTYSDTFAYDIIGNIGVVPGIVGVPRRMARVGAVYDQVLLDPTSRPAPGLRISPTTTTAT